HPYDAWSPGSWCGASTFGAFKKLRYLAQTDHTLRFHGVHRDAQLDGHVLLGHAIYLAQGDDLSAAVGKGLDGLGKQLEFLRAGHRVRYVLALIQDAQAIDIRYGIDATNPLPPHPAEGEIVG